MNLTFTNQDILEAGVAEIIGLEDLQKRLNAGEKLKVKFGIDPTSPNVHLGRSIPLWRLRAFQELGHEIHLIIGDFTGQVGDTSDKTSERPMLTEDQIKYNLENYMEQMYMILNKENIVVHYNSEWLSKLTLGEISQIADSFSVNTFIKRELIARRLEEGSRVSLREMLYPLMQGYDSIMVEADVEIGGTDQRFNLLAGRTIQEAKGKRPQAIIMNHLISGTDGRKMSSSWGNLIKLKEEPNEMFGKVMSIVDNMIAEYQNCLPICARPYTQEELEQRINNGENPRDLKASLAFNLVALYYGDEIAGKAEASFVSQFRDNQIPEDILDFEINNNTNIVDALLAASLVSSKNEARRLIEQKGVKIDGEVVENANQIFDKPTAVVQVGKRKFARLILK